FCERFSYYGMRAVLVLYFKYFLKWDDDFATTIYHTFVALCYLTPILGAIIADSWLGKFKTIIYLSIVYAAGQIVLAVSAIHDITDTNKDGVPDNMTFHVMPSEKQRSTFFSIFYLSINAGSLLSTIITPILRAQQCGIHTKQQCYPLAFGVPAALMVVALIVFIVGSGMYNKTAPQGNILVKVCKCVGFAIKNRFRHRDSRFPKREHWMDWAEEKYDKLLIAQVKMVLKVLFLFIPLPMFWALFDQQGSRWTLQATTMDGNFVRQFTVNPILILVLVPVMDSIVYPLISKCNLNFSPLKRMTVGMFLAALAFVAAALVQLQIDNSLPKFPAATESQAKFINMMNTSVTGQAGEFPLSLPSYTATDDYKTFTGPFSLNLEGAVYPVSLADGTRNTLVIIKDFGDITAKPDEGKNAIRFFNGFSSALNITTDELDFGDIVPNNMSEYRNVTSGKVKFMILDEATSQTCVYEQTLKFGSSFTLLIPPTLTLGQMCQGIVEVTDINPNSVHMAWLIPQYFLITAGEVVFSVTGLEFSYSQAPSNMKAVLQAGWLLTVAVGNIIVLIVAEAATLPDQWAEYILFASLLILVCIIFAIMAYFYTYIDPVQIEAQFSQPEDEKKRKSLEMTKKDSIEKRKHSDSNSLYQTKM
uniref:Solute carrier family 15 member 1 n=1 Tax=Periophthalmus magnuspinnatus TaxID=409849 RepID=A0A3B4APN8_9GOBI